MLSGGREWELRLLCSLVVTFYFLLILFFVLPWFDSGINFDGSAFPCIPVTFEPKQQVPPTSKVQRRVCLYYRNHVPELSLGDKWTRRRISLPQPARPSRSDFPRDLCETGGQSLFTGPVRNPACLSDCFWPVTALGPWVGSLSKIARSDHVPGIRYLYIKRVKTKQRVVTKSFLFLLLLLFIQIADRFDLSM